MPLVKAWYDLPEAADARAGRLWVEPGGLSVRAMPLDEFVPAAFHSGDAATNQPDAGDRDAKPRPDAHASRNRDSAKPPLVAPH